MWLQSRVRHIADLNAAEELKKLETMVDDVNATLREYRDQDATGVQKPEVDGLIADVEKYKGAMDHWTPT